MGQPTTRQDSFRTGSAPAIAQDVAEMTVNWAKVMEVRPNPRFDPVRRPNPRLRI